MATKRLKFPETRAWVLCNNFNQRTLRIQNEIRKKTDRRLPLQFVTWNQTARKLYRYFFYQITETSPRQNLTTFASPWTLRIQGLIRELRRRNSDHRRLWQRRVFQILEVWSAPVKASRPRIDQAWQTCAQILTSANHWCPRLKSPSIEMQSWTNVLWRAAHLNHRTRRRKSDPAWQVTYRIICTFKFRSRGINWNKAFARVSQGFD